jgi:hypothetical protein
LLSSYFTSLVQTVRVSALLRFEKPVSAIATALRLRVNLINFGVQSPHLERFAVDFRHFPIPKSR